MDDNFKVSVRNTKNHPVVVMLPDLKFSRTWAQEASYKIPFEILKEAMYDVGFEVFIKKGILVIEDKEARVELGLEEAENEAPKTYKILTKAQMLKTLKASTFEDFLVTIKEIGHEQCLVLIDLAIEQGTVDMNKAQALKEISGIDVVKAIQLKKQNEEKTKEE